MPSLNVWCNGAMSEVAAARLRDGLGGHRLIGDARLEEADVAFGQPDVGIVIASPRLRWVQLSSAGYTSYDRDDLRAALRARGAVLTKSSLVYDEPCAQHLLACMLAEARQLPAALENQRGARDWPVRALRARSRLLVGQSVVLVGFGSIARRLAELLGPFRMRVTGVRRRPTGDEPVPTFALGDPAADRAITLAEHVVDVLPASASTARFFDAARLASLRPGAVFYNIGRGATVDQDALAARLVAGGLRAAYLDVTDPEPLPPEHPLWRAPGCVITPHTAGGHEDESERLVAHFLENLRRFVDGVELLDQVF